MNKALAAIHMHLMLHVAIQGKGTSNTKKGPGRMPANRSVGAPRLQTRTKGGNWQGANYLSYQEHDRCTRAHLLDVRANVYRGHGYESMRDYIIESRGGPATDLSASLRYDF